MKRAPVAQFRAGAFGQVFYNVNFARAEAEEMANENGLSVPIYQLFGGKVNWILTHIEPRTETEKN